MLGIFLFPSLRSLIICVLSNIFDFKHYFFLYLRDHFLDSLFHLFFHFCCYFGKLQCLTLNCIHLIEFQACPGWAGVWAILPLCILPFSTFSFSLLFCLLCCCLSASHDILLCPTSTESFSKTRDVRFQGYPPGIVGSLQLSKEPTFFWCSQFCDNVHVTSQRCAGYGTDLGLWMWGLRLVFCWWSAPQSSCWLLTAALDASTLLASLPTKGMCVSLCTGLLSWVSKFPWVLHSSSLQCHGGGGY